MTEYKTITVPSGVAYVKVKATERLARANSLIFDCDGVLIDASNSYNKAIADTSSYLLSILLGERFSSAAMNADVIFAFRKTGGFNNDWNTTYSIVMFVMSQVPKKVKVKYKKVFEDTTKKEPEDPYSRLELAGERIKKEKISVRLQQTKLTKNLLEFAGKLDAGGIESAEEVLGVSKNADKMLASLKTFLAYPGNIGESVITSVFDEHFYGKDLFKKVHGIKARLNISHGAIRNEVILVNRSTLEILEKRFGGSIGIATGRGSTGTFYTFGKLKDFLNPNALVFLEDMDLEKLEKYGKPAPYALLKAAEPFANGRSVIYVGDSAEDLMMVRNANGKARKDFIFAGICGDDTLSKKRLDLFMKEKADIIVASVNDLPAVIKRVVN